MAKLNFPFFLAVFGGWYIMCSLSNVGYVSAQDTIDPDSEEGEKLTTFLSELETYSGLSPLEESERFRVRNVKCLGLNNYECVINVDGDLVWDVRMKLYAKYMAFSYESDEDAEYTLDGCLNTTTTKYTYNECMKRVRQNMIDFLNNDFETEFKTALEGDCNVAENCITVKES